MFRVKANILLGIFFILPFFSHSQNWKVLLQAKGPSTVLSKGVEMGQNGDIYWIGIFEQYVVFGSDTLFSAGSSDGFICKYDASGSVKWCQRFGGTAIDRVLSTTVDKAGNVYLTGGFSDEIIFGNDTLFSQNRDIFVVKYNKAGNVVWAKALEGNLSDFGQGIVVDPQEQIILTGIFMSDSLKISTTTLYKRGSSDMFLLKLDINGQPLWAQQGGAVSTTMGNGLALDSLNRIYLTGSFQDSASFSGQWLHSQGRSDAYVACYEPSGVLKWIQPISGPGFDVGQALAGTQDGVIVTGRFSDRLSIDTFSLAHQGHYDIFMAAYAGNGAVLWAKGIGGIAKDGSYGLEYQKTHGIFLVGEYSDKVRFDQDSLLSKGRTDAFLAKYDLSGHLRWVLSAGGMGDEQAYSTFSTQNQEIFFAGHFRDMAMFDSIILSSGGRDDGFLAKIIDRDTIPPPPPVNILPLAGNIFEDSDENCRADSQELGYARWFILAEPGAFWGLSDPQGAFSLDLPPNSYRLRSLMPRDISSWLYSNCPTLQYAATGSGLTQNPRPLAFGQVEKVAVQLLLSMDADDFVKCQQGRLILQYANIGTDRADDISIKLHIPEQISLMSSDVPFTDQGSGQYLFRPGDLRPQQEGKIQLQFAVSCNAADLIGQNIQLEAEIHSPSVPQRSDPRWNGAELQAGGSCMGGDSALFVIKNVGTASQADSLPIRFYADDVLCKEINIKLAAGDSLGFLVHSLGQTIRLEIQQVAFHPRERWESTFVEACQGDPSRPLSLGQVQHFPQYDPLSGQVFQLNNSLRAVHHGLKWEINPEGRGSQHHIGTDERLYFHLGYSASRTLHQLEITDTLSSWLDPSSMRWEASSHNFELSVDGQGSPVLHFSLSNDSIPSGEQGFVSFSMMLKSGVPEGTQLRHQAWVRADTLAWQPGNWLFHTVGSNPMDPACGLWIKDYSFVKPIKTEISAESSPTDISISPNPFGSYIEILFSNPPRELKIQIFDLSGKLMTAIRTDGRKQLRLNLEDLASGLYLVHIQTDKGKQIHKIIKQ